MSNGKLKFYDYRKIITRPETTTGSPRFLNNIYLSVFYYIIEMQNNARVNNQICNFSQ